LPSSVEVFLFQICINQLFCHRTLGYLYDEERKWLTFSQKTWNALIQHLGTFNTYIVYYIVLCLITLQCLQEFVDDDDDDDDDNDIILNQQVDVPKWIVNVPTHIRLRSIAHWKLCCAIIFDSPLFHGTTLTVQWTFGWNKT